MRETIEIDFKMFGQGIPCLVNKDASEYEACLAIIPGNILASVYAEHGSRLFGKKCSVFFCR